MMAAFIASRAAKFIRSAFPEDDEIIIRMFSDSQFTLFRILNNYEIFKAWVANRLKAI